MTARKKKAKHDPDALKFYTHQTHSGKVGAALHDPKQEFWAKRVLSRDEALLYAMDLMVAASGLSRAEVAQHFTDL